MAEFPKKPLPRRSPPSSSTGLESRRPQPSHCRRELHDLQLTLLLLYRSAVVGMFGVFWDLEFGLWIFPHYNPLCQLTSTTARSADISSKRFNPCLPRH